MSIINGTMPTPNLAAGAPAHPANAITRTAGTQAASAGVQASATHSPPPVEAVSVSAAAQVTTQLLNAARASGGVNETAVAQARAAIQTGTYHVTPEDLAAAMAATAKERPA